MDTIQFEDIRPYSDGELPEAIAGLLKEEAFVSLLAKYVPDIKVDSVESLLDGVARATDFQLKFMFPVLKRVIKGLCSELTVSGRENMHTPSLYMSNHRDIVIDPSFLCMTLVDNGFDTCEIGIGDNLLSTPWVRLLVRINKCFIVKRGLSTREAVKAFVQLSSYIRHAITGKGTSVWIAQREGRAKDSDDRTQDSIIKMFALSGDGSLAESLAPLNITPVSISYEYDPCDYLKAMELQQKRDNPSFRKGADDDMRSMQTGILGCKGRVHYAYTPCINGELERIVHEHHGDRKGQIRAVCELCDRQIFSAYRIYPINCVAYDRLFGVSRFAGRCTAEERHTAEDYLASRLAKIEMPGRDEPFLRRKLLEMYANPLINKLSVTGDI